MTRAKRALRPMLGVCLALLLMCSVCITAFAEAGTPSLDLTQEGSITVTLSPEDAETGVTDGVLTLYQVADLTLENGDMTWVYTDAFRGCDLSLEGGLESILASDLAAYITENGISGTAGALGEDGSVTFAGLSLGLYLVVQTADSTGFYPIEPFLVTVPLEEGDLWVYDVDASPKTEVTPEEGENPPGEDNPPDEEEENPPDEGEENPPDEEEENPPDEGEENPPETPGEETPGEETPGEETPGEEEPILPQTGQLNWPIPVLAAFGVILVVVGLVLRRRKHEA